MPVFDDLFTAAHSALDECFAAPAAYRPGGDASQAMSVTASIDSVEEDVDKQLAPSTDILYGVELYLADLVLAGGQAWPVAVGDEIAFVQPDGVTTLVYTVVNGSKGRPSIPLDTVGRKLLAYAKYIRKEAA